MKSFLLATVASVGLLTASAASAADMPVKAVEHYVEKNWTGFYFGASVGAGWWKVTGTYVTPPPDNHSSRSDGRPWVDGHIGVQYQWGHVVLGIEGDIAGSFNRDFSRSVTPSGDCLNISQTADRTCAHLVSNVSTLGGRLGYAWDRVMLYGTGGWARGLIEDRTFVTSTGVQTSGTSANHNGWFVGAGLDYMIACLSGANVVLGIDYKHIELNTQRHIQLNAVDNRDIRGTTDIVSARLSFLFSPGQATVHAKY
jgi:outer membrane immunogenic protein